VIAHDIEDLAAQLATDLDEIEQDFESRCRLIEMLNVQATLKGDDRHKVIYVDVFWERKLCQLIAKMLMLM